MGFVDEVEQSVPRPCHQMNGSSKRTCELTSSIVPRGTSFHGGGASSRTCSASAIQAETSGRSRGTESADERRRVSLCVFTARIRPELWAGTTADSVIAKFFLTGSGWRRRPSMAVGFSTGCCPYLADKLAASTALCGFSCARGGAERGAANPGRAAGAGRFPVCGILFDLIDGGECWRRRLWPRRLSTGSASPRRRSQNTGRGTPACGRPWFSPRSRKPNPAHPIARPVSADMAPSHRSRTRSNHLGSVAASPRNLCTHKRIGMRPSASSPFSPCRSGDR